MRERFLRDIADASRHRNEEPLSHEAVSELAMQAFRWRGSPYPPVIQPGSRAGTETRATGKPSAPTHTSISEPASHDLGAEAGWESAA